MFAFALGAVAGWFAHRYKSQIETWLKDTFK